MAGGRPRGVENLDEPLERDVGVRERPERHVPRVREQIGEPRTGFDVGAQHERVDEHADQVVERLLAASGHRVPIATSSVAAERDSSTDIAACTTMNSDALRSCAIAISARCTSAGTVKSIFAPR